MSREEAEFAIEMAAAEGWNPGVHDGELFYEADPEGFFLLQSLRASQLAAPLLLYMIMILVFSGSTWSNLNSRKKRHRNETDRKMPGTPGRQKHRA